METNKGKKKVKRTLKQRAEEIFDLINNNIEPIAKSRFKDIGLSSTAADNWLDLIIYIQNQNRIQLIKSGKYTFVDKEDKVFFERVSKSKYLQVCWNNFLNVNEPHDRRLSYLNDFGKAYFSLERSKLDQEI
ncbi:MAG: hypothetical protein ACFFAJ_10075 [Candidatus Hodarchaeota archaeon]